MVVGTFGLLRVVVVALGWKLCVGQWTVSGGLPQQLLVDNAVSVESSLLWYKDTVRTNARDGTELYNVIYLPKKPDTGVSFPIVFVRTPYNAQDQAPLQAALWLPRGYGVVEQDMRGRGKSRGEWAFWEFSGTDAYDTIPWITNQTWCDGTVLAFGISADANAVSMEEIPTPPPTALKAQFIVVGTGELYRTVYQNGLYREFDIAGWSKSIEESDYLVTLKENEQYGPYWYPTDLSRNWTNVNVPAVHWGGWYDFFNKGTLASFNGYHYLGGPGARGSSYLIMSPGGHCPTGEYPWPANSFSNIAFNIGFALFQAVAAGEDPNSIGYHHIILYVMGSSTVDPLQTPSGNFWICTDEWPAVVLTPMYLNTERRLSQAPPAGANSMTIVADPSIPVETVGGDNLIWPSCGPWDQRAVERRYDVVSFDSAPLTEPLAIVGNVSLTIFISSTAVDTDIVAKVVDVYQDGTAYNVLDNGLRMRWRESDEVPTFMEPGVVYEVTIDLFSTAYVFDAGHTIRLDLTSSNYPRFSLNRNNGQLLAESNGENIIAYNTLHYGNTYVSALNLPVVNFDGLKLLECQP